MMVGILYKTTLMVIFISLFGLFSCRFFAPKRPPKTTPIRFANANKMYRRDSIYIAHTIYEFINKGVEQFDIERKKGIPISKIRVDVDTILYSLDTLKLFALIIQTIPDFESKDSNAYYFDGQNIEGFRTSTHKPWIIYPHWFSSAIMTDYNYVRLSLRNDFFVAFKNNGTAVWDSVSQEMVIAKFNFNVDEPGFWSSVVWKKGACTPGFYIFQNNGSPHPDAKDPVIILPHLDYPDSLLNMYNN